MLNTPLGHRSKPNSVPLRQLRQQEVDTTVNALVRAIGLKDIVSAPNVKASILLRQSDTHGMTRFGQRNRHNQLRPDLAFADVELHAFLLAKQSFEAVGMGLDNRPNRMQWSCQIRPKRYTDGQRPITIFA